MLDRSLRHFILLLIIIFTGCNDTSLFESIDNQLAAPIAVAVDTARARAYVVNSNINYDFTDTTLSLLDITNPAAPTLLSSTVNPISIPNFSGQIYLDTTTATAYVTNRLSDDVNDEVDALLTVNLDEASADFGTVSSFSAGENPFGIACCDASGRIYVVNNGGTLQIYDPADLSTSIQVSLDLTLSTQDLALGSGSTEVAISADGSMAFVSNNGGHIYGINTSDVGDTSKNPIDYVILNVEEARGLALSGTTLYMVDGTLDAEVVRKLDVSTLTPVSPDAAAPSEVDAATLQATTISVGENPNEIILFDGKAYISNQDDDSVTVVDLSNDSVVATITVGDKPFGLTVFASGGTDYLYVTNLLDNSLSIIDLGTNTVVATFLP